jgi:hypothetical protein
MDKSTYTLAGWLAIAAAVLALPLLLLAIVVDVGAREGTELLPVLLTLYAGLTVAQTGMHLYAFYRLRHLLNERFGFHAVDTLIVAMIVLMLAMVSVSLLGRIGLATGLVPAEVTPLLVGMIVVFGVPMAVLSIVFNLPVGLGRASCSAIFFGPSENPPKTASCARLIHGTVRRTEHGT